MKIKSKLITCRTCKGSGVGRFVAFCPFCKGSGQLDPTKCFRCGKRSSATVTTKQFGIEYVCESCLLTIEDSQRVNELFEKRKIK